MTEIVFVCTGNTCRSPMAEGLFRAMGGEEKLGVKAASAGLFAQDGMRPTPFAVDAVKELGADITAHHARQLTAEIVERAKYLVCMTAAHYDRLIQEYPQAEEKTYMLMKRDVSDPFGGDLHTYRRCAAQLQEGIAELIAALGKQA